MPSLLTCKQLKSLIRFRNQTVILSDESGSFLHGVPLTALKQTCSQLASHNTRLSRGEKEGVLLYGAYLLPYNSEIKLVGIEESELKSEMIDFPLKLG